MDAILTLQDEIRLIKNTEYTHYDYYSVNLDMNEIDDKMDDVIILIEDQFDNAINKSKLKAVLNGIKAVLVNQLSKGNSRKWKKWEEETLYNSVYQPNMRTVFDEAYGKPATGVKKYVKSSSAWTNRPKKKLKYDVVVSDEISTFIKQMMFLNKSTEWGVTFTWTLDKEKKQLIIDRIYIMPVEVGGAHVKFINESEFRIFSDISELGEFVTDIDNKTRFAGMMHSHHTMGSWHSATDHGTIDTYVNDFQSILSIVWAWNGKEGDITADIILQTKNDSYEVDNSIFGNDYNSNDLDLQSIDNKYTSQYNDMLTIVKKDYASYKKFMKRFENTGKYTKIEELYHMTVDKDNVDQSIKLIKDLTM